MTLFRANLHRVTLATLSLLLCWIAIGVIHQHPDDPTCEICKLLHSGAARLGTPPSSPDPGTFERVSLPATEHHARILPPRHQVRGPPIS